MAGSCEQSADILSLVSRIPALFIVDFSISSGKKILLLNRRLIPHTYLIIISLPYVFQGLFNGIPVTATSFEKGTSHCMDMGH
jgi:hypothetical protein